MSLLSLLPIIKILTYFERKSSIKPNIQQEILKYAYSLIIHSHPNSGVFYRLVAEHEERQKWRKEIIQEEKKKKLEMFRKVNKTVLIM